MSKIPEITKFIADHPELAHPEFDLIMNSLSKLETIVSSMNTSYEESPELERALIETKALLVQAQQDLERVAILEEPIFDERALTDNNK